MAGYVTRFDSRQKDRSIRSQGSLGGVVNGESQLRRCTGMERSRLVGFEVTAILLEAMMRFTLCTLMALLFLIPSLANSQESKYYAVSKGRLSA